MGLSTDENINVNTSAGAGQCSGRRCGWELSVRLVKSCIPPYLISLCQQSLGHADTGDVDQTAIEADGALA